MQNRERSVRPFSVEQRPVPKSREIYRPCRISLLMRECACRVFCGPAAPVAVGTFPGRPARCRYPSNAKATASFASPSKKVLSKSRTSLGATCSAIASHERRVLRTSTGQENFRDGLGDESLVRISDTARGEQHRRRNDVFVGAARRLGATGCDEIIGVLHAEKLGPGGLRRSGAEVLVLEKSIDDFRDCLSLRCHRSVDIVRDAGTKLAHDGVDHAARRARCRRRARLARSPSGGTTVTLPMPPMF